MIVLPDEVMEIYIPVITTILLHDLLDNQPDTSLLKNVFLPF